ncbi:MAG: hypothetical protein MH252_00500 [Thermosynechococcaceae cyanobacterium MS004]|nr:hypothetical protein [Thermosynechococcaceae cyanobacterium MS004]
MASLNVGDTVYELCEPCGETRPRPLSISSLAAETTPVKNLWQVKVNNSGIDLAYVFVATGRRGQASNLAKLSGCPASSVSSSLILR